MRRKKVRIPLKPLKPIKSKPTTDRPVELPMPEPISTQLTMHGPKVTASKVEIRTAGVKVLSKIKNTPLLQKRKDLMIIKNNDNAIYSSQTKTPIPMPHPIKTIKTNSQNKVDQQRRGGNNQRGKSK